MQWTRACLKDVSNIKLLKKISICAIKLRDNLRDGNEEDESAFAAVIGQGDKDQLMTF